ncbi:unnamed protein product [Nezara viridula]|uniref:Uncharacterized protein n=1 Tax=Nezara viridula TaxID=85310 RepID=A0A9P0MMB2_NEZVI|nr:unnamed protein product [Nezara viridula]
MHDRSAVYKHMQIQAKHQSSLGILIFNMNIYYIFGLIMALMMGLSAVTAVADPEPGPEPEPQYRRGGGRGYGRGRGRYG